MTTRSGTRISWNQGRIVRPKPPLKPKHIWAIRTRLQHDGRVRDLAMFNTAIDSKLRGCDVVKLRVVDIHLGDSVRLRTTIIQQKTTSLIARGFAPLTLSRPLPGGPSPRTCAASDGAWRPAGPGPPQ